VLNDFLPIHNLQNISFVIDSVNALQNAKAHLQVNTHRPGITQSKQIIYTDEKGASYFAWHVVFITDEKTGEWEAIVDGQSGDVLRILDNACYADGTGKVFNPNPITSAQTVYGASGFTDNNDQDSPELTNELLSVTLRDIERVEGEYRLIGPFCSIFDWNDPHDEEDDNAWMKLTSDFSTTRSDKMFEAVNVYYHITESQYYIQSLGFANIRNNSIRCDPHGSDGKDESSYSPTFDHIEFGEGGVDDAEDADVILHEYGHAIQNHIGEHGTWQAAGGEYRTLGEGFGDYWGGSYSRSITSFNWHLIGNWKWHNEFGEGRILNSTKTYDDRTGDIYEDGTIWASTLMDIWTDYGRTISDKLVLQSHYYVIDGGNYTMVDNAQAILQADIDLYGGEHLDGLMAIFENRNYPIQDPRLNVDVDQIRTSGQPIADNKVRYWEESIFTEYDVPHTFAFVPGAFETFMATKELYDQPYEKFFQWNGSYGILNHNTFEISEDVDRIESSLNAISLNISIENSLSSSNSSAGVISFSDPWFYDDPDANHQNEKQNRGISAIFHQRPSPFSPIIKRNMKARNIMAFFLISLSQETIHITP